MSQEPALTTVEQTAPPAWLTPSAKAFVSLAMAHTLIDCYSMPWSMFKTLAGLDLGRAGMIGAIVGVIALGLQPFFGMLADHGQRRKLVLLGCSLVMAPMLFGPISMYPKFMHRGTGYLVMFLILLIGQLGSAMFHPPAVAVAGQMSSGRRSTFITLFIACGMLGMMASHKLFSFVFKTFNRHTELMLIPGAMIVLMVALWYHVPQRHDGRQLGVTTLYRRIMTLPPRIIPLWVLLVMVSAMNTGMIFLMPEFISARGLAEGWVNGGAMMLFVVGSVVMMVPMGHLSDRFGRKRMLVMCLVLSVPIYLVMLLVGDLPPAVFLALLCLFGACLGTSNPLGISLGQHMVRGNESLVTGILMGFAWAVASPARWVVGVLGERPDTGPTGALLWLGITLIVAIVMALVTPAAPSESNPGQALSQNELRPSGIGL